MRGNIVFAFLIGTGLLVSACAGPVNVGENQQPDEKNTRAAGPTATPAPAENETREPTAPQTEALSPPTLPVEARSTPSLLAEEPPPTGAEREFSTDFSRHTVPYSEILSGGPPKDGIPAIDDPQFISVDKAAGWLKPAEPVILVTVGEERRAYPLQILTWHEIVNDTVGGLPLVVTFCPLCNTAIAFERTVNGEVLDFGTTGRLRYSNLIMYDRQTETWWQQANGEAIAGELVGQQLAFYPAVIVSWEEFQASYPEGKVLSRQTGFARDYGRNPYPGYDDINSSPFLFRGSETPDELPAMARVLTIDLEEEAVAFPYSVLKEQPVVNETIAGVEIVVFWEAGTASALDTFSLAEGRDVGTAAAYERRLNGETLRFVFEDEAIRDEQTGSRWDLLGRAVEGPLEGEALEPATAINHFWFSWAAFRPDTRIYQP